MAIDTQTKRRSVAGYTNNPIYPVPDTVISALDREHETWLYPLGADAPVGPPVDEEPPERPPEGTTTIITACIRGIVRLGGMAPMPRFGRAGAPVRVQLTGNTVHDDDDCGNNVCVP